MVYGEDYIPVWVLVECFKTCKGFEDIENSSSLSLSLLTSEFLKKDSNDHNSTSYNGQAESEENGRSMQEIREAKIE